MARRAMRESPKLVSNVSGPPFLVRAAVACVSPSGNVLHRMAVSSRGLAALRWQQFPMVSRSS